MIVKEWRCLAHGDFEAPDMDGAAPECPMGCDTVERVFLTPVGFRSEATNRIDSTVQDIARRHGLTDMNNRGGKAAVTQDPMRASRDEEFRRFIHERYGDGWGKVPEGGVYNVRDRKVESVEGRNGAGAPGALGAYHARPDNVLAEVKDKGALVPKPVLLRADHENLKVSDARPPA